MTEKIYELKDSGLVFPDATVLKTSGEDLGRLLVVESNKLLFPESSSNLEAAKELKSELSEMQTASQDTTYEPTLDKVRRFGIQSGAEDVVSLILDRFVKICREKRAQGMNFTPGVQYNHYRVTDHGMEVTFGDYGLFFATLAEAAQDSAYKRHLIKEGLRILGRKDGFFVNPPATNTVVECKDGLLFVKRGNTAEYPYMLHQVAAGHHYPEQTYKPDTKVIELDTLIGYQILTEVGIDISKQPEHLKSILDSMRFNGVAYSTGSKLIGTEKAEILSAARLELTAEQIWDSIQTAASHKWETQQLMAVPQQYIGHVLGATLDSSKKFEGFQQEEVKIFGVERGSLGKDLNSFSRWVPVGVAGLLMHLGTSAYEPYLPQSWK